MVEATPVLYPSFVTVTSIHSPHPYLMELCKNILQFQVHYSFYTFPPGIATHEHSFADENEHVQRCAARALKNKR